jgi:hypothetical protein
VASYGIIVSPKFQNLPQILGKFYQNTFFLDIVSVSPHNLGKVYPWNSSQNSVAQKTFFLHIVSVSPHNLGKVYPWTQNTFFLEGAVEAAKN